MITAYSVYCCISWFTSVRVQLQSHVLTKIPAPIGSQYEVIVGDTNDFSVTPKEDFPACQSFFKLLHVIQQVQKLLVILAPLALGQEYLVEPCCSLYI